MTQDPSAYDIQKIRQLLIEAFTDEELRRFCLDRPAFRPVVDRLGREDGLDDIVDEVIDYCRTQLLWDELLAAVKEVNPRQYARFELYLRISVETPSRQPSTIKIGKDIEIPARSVYLGAAGLLAGLLVLILMLWQASRDKPAPTPASDPEPTSTPQSTVTLTPEPTNTPSPTPTSSPEPTSRPSPWSRPTDGMEMVYIPASESVPYLFLIDGQQVTNAQYCSCALAGDCSKKPKDWELDYWYPAIRCDEDPGLEDEEPVVGVNWEYAQAYVDWLSTNINYPRPYEGVYRLPTQKELEQAYEVSGDIAGFRIGSEWEWTQTAEEGNPQRRWVCGGLTFSCESWDSGVRSKDSGFRLVLSPSSP
jgi:hypothetical protein